MIDGDWIWQAWKSNKEWVLDSIGKWGDFQDKTWASKTEQSKHMTDLETGIFLAQLAKQSQRRFSCPQQPVCCLCTWALKSNYLDSSTY